MTFYKKWMHACICFPRDRSGVSQLEFLIANNGHQLHSLKWKKYFVPRAWAQSASSDSPLTQQPQEARPCCEPAITREPQPPCIELTAVLSDSPLCRGPHALPSPSRIQALTKGVWCVSAQSASPLGEGDATGGGGRLRLLLNSALPPGRKMGWRAARTTLSIAVSFTRFSKGPWPCHFCQKRLWITALDYL